MSPRKIAAGIGAGKSTVYEYLARAEAAGVTWPLPEGLDEAAVEAKLFPEPSAELAAHRPVPDWREVHREVRQHAAQALGHYEEAVAAQCPLEVTCSAPAPGSLAALCEAIFNLGKLKTAYPVLP